MAAGPLYPTPHLPRFLDQDVTGGGAMTIWVLGS
jgi:hypothetical protein